MRTPHPRACTHICGGGRGLVADLRGKPDSHNIKDTYNTDRRHLVGADWDGRAHRDQAVRRRRCGHGAGHLDQRDRPRRAVGGTVGLRAAAAVTAAGNNERARNLPLWCRRRRRSSSSRR
jgi:hypothetical protein